MRSWRWGPIPARLVHDPRVMMLTRAERGVFLSLYCAADEHGLFAADEMPLRLALGLMEPEPVQPAILRCAQVGLVHLYRLGAVLYGVVDQYDSDADPKTLADRPVPTLPMPPADVCERSRCSGTFSKKVGGKKTELCEPPSAGAVAWVPEVQQRYLGGTSEVHPTVTGGTPEVQAVCSRGAAEVGATVTGGTPEVRPRSLQDSTGQDKTGEGYAPARVPIYERTPEPAPAQQDSPQRGYATSAYALNEGQQVQAQRQEAALPPGAMKLPTYEAQAPRGMGGRVSARYDGTQKANERWGGWPVPESHDPEGDALAEQRRSRLNAERNARRFGFASLADMERACEEAAAQPSTYDPNAAPPTEDELMAKMRVAQERERRHREELHRERMAELAEGDETDDEPAAPADAATIRDSYLRALGEGALP